MDSVKYIGMDVHKEAISLAVLNSSPETYQALRRALIVTALLGERYEHCNASPPVLCLG
jgi:hypothetical protein